MVQQTKSKEAQSSTAVKQIKLQKLDLAALSSKKSKPMATESRYKEHDAVKN